MIVNFSEAAGDRAVRGTPRASRPPSPSQDLPPIPRAAFRAQMLFHVTQREAVSHHTVTRNQLRQRSHVHVDLRQHISSAGGEPSRFEIPVETNSSGSVGSRSAAFNPRASASAAAIQFGWNESCRFLRHGDAHRATVVKSELNGKDSRAGLLPELERALPTRGRRRVRRAETTCRSRDGRPAEVRAWW